LWFSAPISSAPVVDPCPTRRSSDLAVDGPAGRRTTAAPAAWAGSQDGVGPGRRLASCRRHPLDSEGADGDTSPGTPLGRPLICEIGRAHVNSSHVKTSYAVFCLKKK